MPSGLVRNHSVKQLRVRVDLEQFVSITDHLGSVRFVVEAATGTIVQSIIYDEYSIVESDNNPGFAPFALLADERL